MGLYFAFLYINNSSIYEFLPVPVAVNLHPRPMVNASAPDIGRPVINKSRARDKPIRAVKRLPPYKLCGAPIKIFINNFKSKKITILELKYDNN